MSAQQSIPLHRASRLQDFGLCAGFSDAHVEEASSNGPLASSHARMQDGLYYAPHLWGEQVHVLAPKHENRRTRDAHFSASSDGVRLWVMSAHALQPL